MSEQFVLYDVESEPIVQIYCPICKEERDVAILTKPWKTNPRTECCCVERYHFFATEINPLLTVFLAKLLG